MEATTDLLVLDYLKRRGYNATLKAFENELNLTPQEIEYEHLEDIVNDRIKFMQNKLSSEAEISRPSSGFKNWGALSLGEHYKTEFQDALIIHLSATELKIDGCLKSCVLLTLSNKKLIIMDTNGAIVFEIDEVHGKCNGKCCYGIAGSGRVVSCGMNGEVTLIELRDGDGGYTVISRSVVSKRLVIDFKPISLRGKVYIFVISMDMKLLCYSLVGGGGGDGGAEFVSEFKFLSTATSIEAVRGQDPHGDVTVLVTRQDCTQLHVLTLAGGVTLEERLTISLNDSEFSTHGFTPMCISVDPLDETRVAIATSQEPFMRVIVVELPSGSSSGSSSESKVKRGCIICNYNTMSPQDKYSQSRILWRSDGCGIWVAGDDGVIRGIELTTGKVVTEIRCHSKRIKNLVGIGQVLISSGIDKKLVINK